MLKPHIVKLSQSSFSPEEFTNLLRPGIEALRSGGVLALPTDTIYGVAALAQKSKAVNKLYTLKRRIQTKPLAICVHSISEISRWCNVTVTQELLAQLLPGPVTLIFERTSELNSNFNPDTSLVGVRIPDYKFIRELCYSVNEPLALTSANVSNTMSSLNINEFTSLWEDLDVIYDGGRLGDTHEQRAGSTVVNLSQKSFYSVIREGSAFQHTVDILESYGLKELSS